MGEFWAAAVAAPQEGVEPTHGGVAVAVCFKVAAEPDHGAGEHLRDGKLCREPAGIVGAGLGEQLERARDRLEAMRVRRGR